MTGFTVPYIKVIYIFVTQCQVSASGCYGPLVKLISHV